MLLLIRSGSALWARRSSRALVPIGLPFVACTLAACALVGCTSRGSVEDADGGGVRGPEGGVLRFDAAMLEDPPDAAPPLPRPDAGRRDAGRPDTGAPRRCAGLPRSCSSYGSSSGCVTQSGCRRDGDCSGSATSCYGLFDSYSCSSQDGCYWSSFDRDCSGSARACSSYYSYGTCFDQRGCSWSDTCSGVATSCASFSEATCALQEGCYLE